jgi:hypothetical protein
MKIDPDEGTGQDPLVSCQAIAQESMILQLVGFPGFTSHESLPIHPLAHIRLPILGIWSRSTNGNIFTGNYLA